MNLHTCFSAASCLGSLLLLTCGCQTTTGSQGGTAESAYVQWEGNQDGVWVSDGGTSQVRFRINGTQAAAPLEWNGSLWNMCVSRWAKTSEIYDCENSKTLGSVVAASRQGRNIAAFVNPDGNYVLLSANANGSLHVGDTTTKPGKPVAASTGGGGKAGGACSQSTCDALTSQCGGCGMCIAVCYCASACACKCAGDAACEQSSRQAAQQLGTTCSY